MGRTPTLAEIETRRRLILTVAAYAYECCGESIMSDADYDAGARLVDLGINTNRPHLDAWWRENFDPDTGMWVRRHPELAAVEHLYETRWRGRTVRLGSDGVYRLA